MNPDTFPYVSEDLTQALRETFPITSQTLSQSHEKILEERGRQSLIDWLCQMHEAQTNKEPTE
jgi:hypothetical protein